jgi:hypothetical protein
MYAIEYNGRTKRDEIFLCASDAALRTIKSIEKALMDIYATCLEVRSTGKPASKKQ